MISALIFDFDGLILDTETPEYQAWSEVYQQLGVTFPFEVWVECIGRGWSSFDPYDYLEQQVGQLQDREIIRTRRRQRYLELISAQPILPGVLDSIDKAHSLGLKVAIASSSSRRWIDRYLVQRGISELFDVIKCKDDVVNAKPAPDLYLATLAALGITAAEAIAFEDSPNGVTAANAAGIYCVAVPNPMTRELPLDHADQLVSSLAELNLQALLAR
ncbi:MAG: HAD family hydrolase [bacterium]